MYLNRLFVSILVLALTAGNTMAAVQRKNAQEPSADNSTAAAENTSDNAKIKAEPEHEDESVFGSVNTFLASDFITTSIWPGIGPFHSVSDDKGNKLVDPTENHLTYLTVGKQISTCELEMRGGSTEAQNVLNLQMSTDFLLEGLGVKAGKIHIVNGEIAKNSKLLTGNNYNPVSVSIAPYLVSFQNLGTREGTDIPLYRVAVINQDLAGNKNTKEGGITEEKDENIASASSIMNEKKEVKPKQEEKITKKAEKTIVAKTSNENKIASVNTETKPTAEKETPESTEQQVPASKEQPVKEKGEAHTVTSTTPANTINTTTTETKPQPHLSKDEQLKKDFLTVIQNWQRLKKTAVRERKTDILGQSLAGRALVRQADAIKWLASNHKYYDMNPAGAMVQKINPIIAGKKYAVFAEVKEKTKYMDDSSGQIGKETDDTYQVNYTIEKIGEHWLITDSTLVKPNLDKSSKPTKTTASLSKSTNQ